MSLTEPIVEGAYYLCSDGIVRRAGVPSLFQCKNCTLKNGMPCTRPGTCCKFLVGGLMVDEMGRDVSGGTMPTKVVSQAWFVLTDPADVVAELRRLSATEKRKCSNPDYERHHSTVPAAYSRAADLVAKKLRVTE